MIRTKGSVERCPVFVASKILGRRWMILILQVMMTNPSTSMRFSEIQRELSWVSPKVLTQRLRELEAETILNREVFSESIPPHVTYALTQKGRDLQPALNAMQSWGIKHGGYLTADCLGEGLDRCRECTSQM